MYELYDRGEQRVTAAHIRWARRAYYAMIGYGDAQLGKLVAALKATDKDQSTLIVVTADHGDMLGERGLWYKMNFFERSVRVPLILHAPGLLGARRIKENVSLVDLLPTLVEAASDGAAFAPVVPIDGASLLPAATGATADPPDTVFGEYLAEGTPEPTFMIRRGPHKYVCGAGEPPQLFDLAADPLELANLAERADHAALAASFAEEASDKWNGASLGRDIVAGQRARRLVHGALTQGRVHPWDYQPRFDAATGYYRNYGGEDPERPARIPPPDGGAAAS